MKRGALQSAYLGFYASAELAGRGYMREGLALVLRHAFAGLKLHRVEANVQPGNERSRALVRGAGFELEGYYVDLAGTTKPVKATIAQDAQFFDGDPAAQIRAVRDYIRFHYREDD